MSKNIEEKNCCGSSFTNNLYLLLIGLVVLTLVNSYIVFSLNNKVNLMLSGNLVANPGLVEANPTDAQPTGNQNQPQEVPRVQISLDDDPVMGSEDAPVTIVEFSDFQCPFCARFFSQTLPLIEKDYIDSGKVKLVYRDFPLSFHQNAQKAAEASECADEQGKFWEYHDKMFENQNALDTTSLKKYAEDLGLDTAEFNDCLDSGQMASKVQNDVNDGQKYGVTGTPTFFINGIKVVGAQPYSAFHEVINQELNR